MSHGEAVWVREAKVVGGIPAVVASPLGHLVSFVARGTQPTWVIDSPATTRRSAARRPSTPTRGQHHLAPSLYR
jgi:hypothetical protein